MSRVHWPLNVADLRRPSPSTRTPFGVQFLLHKKRPPLLILVVREPASSSWSWIEVPPPSAGRASRAR